MFTDGEWWLILVNQYCKIIVNNPTTATTLLILFCSQNPWLPNGQSIVFWKSRNTTFRNNHFGTQQNHRAAVGPRETKGACEEVPWARLGELAATWDLWTLSVCLRVGHSLPWVVPYTVTFIDWWSVWQDASYHPCYAIRVLCTRRVCGRMNHMGTLVPGTLIVISDEANTNELL